MSDEASQALQVLRVEFNVVVARPLHPQRLHGLGAKLEQRQAVGEVDHLVLGAVDDQHGRRDLGHFLDAAKKAQRILLIFFFLRVMTSCLNSSVLHLLATRWEYNTVTRKLSCFGSGG